MLDGRGWRADALPARGFRAANPPAAWVARVFVFVALHSARTGAVANLLCAGHAGSWIFRASEDRSFDAGDRSAAAEIRGALES